MEICAVKIKEIKELVEKTTWNKYRKDDILDLITEYPDYADMTPAQLRRMADKLSWDAESMYQEVGRLECEATVIKDLADILERG